MYALISPIEQARNNQGIVLGQRVAQVAESTFPVALPFYWIPCDNNVIADQFYFDVNTQTIIPIES